MSLVAVHDALIGAKATSKDPFAEWYPRWGSTDLLLAINGIYNDGYGLPHNVNAVAWTDVANGIELQLKRGTPNWEDNGLACTSNAVTFLGDLDLSNVSGFTCEVFGYYGVNWGVLSALCKSSSKSIVDVMPNGDNIGATINIQKSGSGQHIQYNYPVKPSTTDLCVSCGSDGVCKVYVNGTEVSRTTGQAYALASVQSIRSICVGTQYSGAFSPNGSIIYGATVYGDVLDDSEILSLYQKNLNNYIG